MISTVAKKFILNITVLFFYTNHANASAGCPNNADRRLYTEIGCKPIYDHGDSNSSCPVAYDCEHVFARSSEKCYFNGHVYELKERLSVTDSASAWCLADPICDQQKTLDNKTVTKFKTSYVQCASDISLLASPCYYQFNRYSCCEIGKHCPKKNEKVHECVYNGITYKNGQRFIVDNYAQCVCSPDFDGTVTDRSCRKLSCNYEILYMENILNRNAPVFLEKSDGCPFKWFNVKHDVATAVGPTTPVDDDGSNKSRSYECKYGDFSFSLGQQVNIGPHSGPSAYETLCSCKTPPLITCDRVEKKK